MKLNIKSVVFVGLLILIGLGVYLNKKSVAPVCPKDLNGNCVSDAKIKTVEEKHAEQVKKFKEYKPSEFK